ncbi:hypothetical protein [Achromobacter sp.]|uniref:hypothetical protein n=1 Tax=Achromobacter sp. TaxID=134375 RepID=UPI003C72D2A0
MNQKQRATSRRRIPRKAWVLGLIVAAGAGFYAWKESPLGPGLTEDKIRKILITAMATPTNAPGSACVNVVGVRPLPTDVYTAFLDEQDKIVQGLIKHQLITVKRVSASGDGSAPQPGENPEDASSRMELTEKGRAYYTDGEARIGSNRVYTAKFCAPGLQVGKILDYSKPGKNPFDDNPNAVSAVKFEWRLDRATADWAADPAFYPQISGFPSEYQPDEWQTRHIMLERKNGVWDLGDDPYKIRW